MFVIYLLLSIVIQTTYQQFGVFDASNCLKKQCYEEFGCFSTDSFLDEVRELLHSRDNLVKSVKSALTLKQLLSICPMDPKGMNVTFLLFTKHNPNRGLAFDYRPDTDQFKTSGFKADKRTVFIVHGYTDEYTECKPNGDCLWMASFKNYFLNLNYNVIAVDWRSPANSINYFNSAFNTQIVGAIVARFIDQLITELSVNPIDIHLIGHSLGAHVSGFAGKRYQTLQNVTKLGHITGLDPAGPGFSSNKLWHDDAHLVTIIHTSAGITKNVDEMIGENLVESVQLFGILGCDDEIGHFDFWPNGGTGQPGCEKTSFFKNVISEGFSGISSTASCDHSRATELPTAERALREPDSCQLVGYQCDNYQKFNEGQCGDCGQNNEQCKLLEFEPDYWQSQIEYQGPPQTRLFLKTSDTYPYCLFHYQIVVLVEESTYAGTFTIRLKSAQKVINITMTSNLLKGFKSGQTYTKLHTNSQHLGAINEVVVEFDPNIAGHLFKFSNKINPFSSRHTDSPDMKIAKISVNFMSNIDNSYRQKYSTQLFPDGDNLSDDNNVIVFRV